VGVLCAEVCLMGRTDKISTGEYVRAVRHAGFVVRKQSDRQIVVIREHPWAYVAVPIQSEFDENTLQSLIQQAGLAKEEFLDLVESTHSKTTVTIDLCGSD